MPISYAMDGWMAKEEEKIMMEKISERISDGGNSGSTITKASVHNSRELEPTSLWHSWIIFRYAVERLLFIFFATQYALADDAKKWIICMRKSITNPFAFSLIVNKINNEHLNDKINANKLLMYENGNTLLCSFVLMCGDGEMMQQNVYWRRHLRATNVRSALFVGVCSIPSFISTPLHRHGKSRFQ